MTDITALRKCVANAKDLLDKGSNEAEVRRRVDKALETLSGLDSFEHLSREARVRTSGSDEYADLAIVIKGKTHVVIEIKKADLPIRPNHLKQGSRYCYELGCEFLLLTNGTEYKLYMLDFGPPHREHLIHEWHMIDSTEEHLLKMFSLLTIDSIKSGQLEIEGKKMALLSKDTLLEILLSERVINEVRVVAQKVLRKKLTNDEVTEAVKKGLSNGDNEQKGY